MAGSVVVTYTTRALNTGNKIKVASIAWTADAADGSVPNTALNDLSGHLVKVITNPGAVAPTANYDIKLLDHDDSTIDAANAAIVDRHTTSSEIVLPTVPPLLCGNYTFNLTNNAVNSATGVCILFIEE
jgi:hypothetical protein